MSDHPQTDDDALRREVVTGLLSKRFPFVRMGDGAERVVVFPGLNDALRPAPAMPRFWARFGETLGAGRTVYVISRPRNLPAGATTRDMAGALATVIAEHVGPADVIGVSMGGFVAQHLAADHRAMVRRLVVAICGARMNEENRHVSHEWLAWARAGQLSRAVGAMIERTYGAASGARPDGGSRYSPNAALRHTGDASDFIVSLEACMGHDGRLIAQSISVPTLVIGGEEDRMSPPDLCRDLARRIPGAELKLIEGAGHGMFEDHRVRALSAVAEFLNRPVV
jgi:pimeloyl-ACP methyl ester carboxylesterase